MLLDALLFVSKRLQAVVAALICLAILQLASAVQAPPPAVLKVPIAAAPASGQET